MHIVGLLDRPTVGRVPVRRQDVSSLDADALADLRSRALGFVFQAYNLLPRTTAIENVELPMIYAGVPAAERGGARRSKRSTPSGSRSTRSISPTSSPADSSSASRSHARS